MKPNITFRRRNNSFRTLCRFVWNPGSHFAQIRRNPYANTGPELRKEKSSLEFEAFDGGLDVKLSRARGFEFFIRQPCFLSRIEHIFPEQSARVYRV